MLNRILLVFLLSLPFPAQAQIILIFGDSLSAAYGMPIEQGWVALLEDRLSSRGYDYRIVNASISGDTTASGRARLPQVLATNEPAVVVLELGGNDGLRGLSLKEMKNNLADMIIRAQDNGARVLLVGVQLPPNYGPFYTERFQSVYSQLANEFEVKLLPSLMDGVGTEPTLMQSDGVHPNVKAQPLILDQVWERLLPMLESVGPS
jgi:acyl-CoA thioesterase-1